MTRSEIQPKASMTTATLLALAVLGAGLVLAAPAATALSCTGHSTGSGSCLGVYNPGAIGSKGTCAGSRGSDGHCTGAQL